MYSTADLCMYILAYANGCLASARTGLVKDTPGSEYCRLVILHGKPWVRSAKANGMLHQLGFSC